MQPRSTVHWPAGPAPQLRTSRRPCRRPRAGRIQAGESLQIGVSEHGQGTRSIASERRLFIGRFGGSAWGGACVTGGVTDE
jgi:hypothetical protein